MSANDPINRNRPMFGEDLNEALKNAGPRIVGGAGLAVQSNNRQVVATPRDRKPQRRVQWDGRVVSSTFVAPNQWTYTVRERIKTAPGYGGWTDRPNGRMVMGFHRAEDINSGSGVQGHGVNIDNLPGDFATKPLPDGLAVLVTEVSLRTVSGGIGGGPEVTKEYWIDSMNGIDGTCA